MARGGVGESKLTASLIRGLKPEGGKARRLSDGGGLYVEATPAGSKIWRMAYRFDGVQKSLTIGPFPEVSITQARTARDEARVHLVWGRDPGQVKQAAKKGASDQSRLFRSVAERWMENRRTEKKAAKTLTKDDWAIRTLMPALGSKDMRQITSKDVVDALRPIIAAGNLHKADDCRVRLSMIFQFDGAEAGDHERDPARVARGALPRPKENNYAAIVDEKPLGQMLLDLDEYQGWPQTRYALRLAPHVFLRSGSIRRIQWSHYHEDKRLIDLPATIVKMERGFLVPVSDQVAQMLAELREITGGGSYMFPAVFGKHRWLSENTLNVALRRMGYDKAEATFHGFRSTANTHLREAGFDDDWVEKQMTHEQQGVRRAYNKAQYLDDRRRMMTWWSNRLDEMKAQSARQIAHK